jgi:hypothetical protein|tara:strand:+ start:1443 stop:1607 length:165 start_codon:yes stop_codon:yes gene_type:complete
VALEASQAFEELVRNTSSIAGFIEYLNLPGDEPPQNGDLDYVFPSPCRPIVTET